MLLHFSRLSCFVLLRFCIWVLEAIVLILRDSSLTEDTWTRHTSLSILGWQCMCTSGSYWSQNKFQIAPSLRWTKQQSHAASGTHTKKMTKMFSTNISNRQTIILWRARCSFRNYDMPPVVLKLDSLLLLRKQSNPGTRSTRQSRHHLIPQLWMRATNIYSETALV